MMDDQILEGEQQCCSDGNPLDQSMILKLVLEHVGNADIDDLLTCRFVSHAWNKAAVQILETRGFVLQLDYKKLLELKYLLWNTRSMSRRLHGAPCQQQQQLELVSLRLSADLYLRTETYIQPEFIGQTVSEGRTKVSQLSELLTLYPHLRVAYLDIVYYPPPAPTYELINHDLWTLFSLTSAELEGIKICGGEELDYAHFEDFSFEQCYERFEFPRLASIRYEVPWYDFQDHDNDGKLDLTDHVRYLISKAPKLTQLNLNLWLRPGEQSAGQLLTLIKPCSTNLQKLILYLHEDFGVPLLKALSDLKFPKMTSLKLVVTHGICDMNEGIHRFLGNVCTTPLSHFEIYFADCVWSFSEWETREGPQIARTLTRTPSLTSITHFGFFAQYDHSMTDGKHLQDTWVTFREMMARLPSLSSMSIDVGLLFILGGRLQRLGYSDPLLTQFPSFPAITTLEVSIGEANSLKMFELLGMAIRIYLHTFPGVKKLVIKPSKMQLKNSGVGVTGLNDNVMIHAVEFLAAHPGLQVLEIHNYEKAWLDQSPAWSHHYAEDVKCLKLFPPPNGPFPHLNLPALLARYPSLEQLQFGKVAMAGAELHGIRTAIKRMESLKQPISKYKI